jgi:hypothetical protein
MKNQRLVLWLSLALVAYALFEASAWGALWVLERFHGVTYSGHRTFALTDGQQYMIQRMMKDKGGYHTYSARLGWTIKPNGRNQNYRSNGQGLRGREDYSRAPPPGRIRIASFGDSFTHGTEVAFEDTWQQIMQAGDPRLEVLNFGVGAYGLDQSFLRYIDDGAAFSPRIVLIGFLSENINRNVSVFRPFYFPNTSAPFTKPRFLLDGDGLRLAENPYQAPQAYQALLDAPDIEIPRLGRHDYFYRSRYQPHRGAALPSVRLFYTAAQTFFHHGPYRTLGPGRVYDVESEAFAVTTRLFDRFYEQARSAGSTPIIVLFPHRRDLAQFLDQGNKRYGPLIEHFTNKGYRYVDVLDGIAQRASAGDVDGLFEGGGHFSRTGNETVAAQLVAYLRDQGLVGRSALVDGTDPGVGSVAPAR